MARKSASVKGEHLQGFQHRIQDMHRKIAFGYPLHEQRRHHFKLSRHFSGFKSQKLSPAELSLSLDFLNGLYFDLTMLTNTKKEFFKAFPEQAEAGAKLSLHANEIALHQLQSVLVKVKKKLKTKRSKKKKKN